MKLGVCGFGLSTPSFFFKKRSRLRPQVASFPYSLLHRLKIQLAPHAQMLVKDH